MAYYHKKTNSSHVGKELQYRFRQLPLHHKLVGIGGLVSLIGVFLPWFSYGSKAFNGLQDTTFLIGYIIFTLSLLMVLVFVIRALDKKFPKMPMKEYTLAMVSGFQVLLLSIVAFSLYTKGSLYFSETEIGMGLTPTAIGGILVFIGGYLSWKLEREETVKKTFMHMPEQENSKDLEKIFQKTKDDNKLMTAEESTPVEHRREEAAPESNEKMPPNLKMFDE